ncbi:UDP-N-acetylmuramoyl-L-alanyl-D-glutamate--2,6-diaminopimelate ligase [Arthrobacter caoxuetaonis]|uniref:UDP-N-acetylmuramyl-tripeptide synthetase n=1 Tax=Arthrobacter caoxuetaonis TaxID=2886935 RepID=A0A9X1SG98_9MICC|nr:UDP-N-acetylmuramoyl-L-alanyl-D-glutamate--2,6-diaminopimelate ligase [Arthrobacter caoxuetaonis]MCC3283699.1 UDP-N-acetylmuramoyl-L-alanyl-D-glutamate--2,6-diaminopimelate ligase [Arthrobacter caoxuetaonis]MCC3299159.1 UDP-N-acetylmuramoyl-L-alanyl-D-glutamate--2,6-diaminopimelate ligase [Arthrobacter caoxuetaonis]USQ58838.1 UDP-N-acetylmuramoyl-L-alanyl-D-glutamate--2,6-diaminopimelate ligase [Arthrobacter caoxuetaonis]
MRPERVSPVTLGDAAAALPPGAPAITAAPGTGTEAWGTRVTGISINSREIAPGDLYLALPGARHHGAAFASKAAVAGAAAVLTDPAGLSQLGKSGLPVFVAEDIRRLVGPLSAAVFNSQPRDGSAPVLFGVTGTNGKTTTTYFINSLLQALGQRTGLIGTIEILAGGEAIPSVLTTPESPQVHGLLALMRERKLDAAAMEVSSHAISYRRVDGVVFDVAGFTNLTQDHLDLHGSMEDYFDAKAALFHADRCRRAVVTVDDGWGRQMAAAAGERGVTLLTTGEAGSADWQVRGITREGLGHAFELVPAEGKPLRVRTGLPGAFNVSNAALALTMVLQTGIPAETMQRVLDEHDPFTVEVPGRMQLISEAPASIVDFAHNPDALTRTLESVRRPQGRVIVVFGATGERDQTKRPLMGAIAARLADVVIVTDDDPHDEDEAAIRADVLRGARGAAETGQGRCEVLEVAPRAAAIARAVELARPEDTVLVAGRGHEVWQEVKGVNLALDDRVELRTALETAGFTVLSGDGVES